MTEIERIQIQRLLVTFWPRLQDDNGDQVKVYTYRLQAYPVDAVLNVIRQLYGNMGRGKAAPSARTIENKLKQQNVHRDVITSRLSTDRLIRWAEMQRKARPPGYFGNITDDEMVDMYDQEVVKAIHERGKRNHDNYPYPFCWSIRADCEVHYQTGDRFTIKAFNEWLHKARPNKQSWFEEVGLDDSNRHKPLGKVQATAPKAVDAVVSASKPSYTEAEVYVSPDDAIPF